MYWSICSIYKCNYHARLIVVYFKRFFMAYTEFFVDIKVFSTIVHVIAVVCAMGAAFSIDVLFHFFAADKQLSTKERTALTILSRTVWYGLWAVIVTGGMIFMADPAHYLMSVKFLSKMTIVGILMINGVVIHQYVHKHLAYKGFFSSAREAFARRIAFACGSISVVSWISALAFGVMDSIVFSYSTVMAFYGVLIVCAIIGSQILERTIFGVKK